MSQQESRQTRRRFLTTGAALGISASIAGCSGDFSGEISGDDEESTEAAPATEAPTETPTEEPSAYGTTRELTLAEGDGVGPEGDLARPVTFQGSGDDSVVITMESEEFDTLLILQGPDGDIVAENDDASFGTLNSQIRTTLSESGEYTIWCGSFTGNETGSFTLSIERATEDAGTISYGESQTFTLDRGDGRDPDGDLAKPVRFQGSSGDSVLVSMNADFDAYLTLVGPDGTVLGRNDDGGTGLNSQLSARLPESGEYTIWCGSFSGDETGQFELSLERGTVTSSNTSGAEDAESISYGTSGTFRMVRGDGRDPDGDLARPFTFQGSSGDRVVISMSSETIDTYLTLQGPNGAVVAENDDIEFVDNTNSRIRTTLPETGEYIIWCSSFSGDETGRFELSLELA